MWAKFTPRLVPPPSCLDGIWIGGRLCSRAASCNQPSRLGASQDSRGFGRSLPVFLLYFQEVRQTHRSPVRRPGNPARDEIVRTLGIRKANASLSAVIETAERGKATTIAKHDQPAAVVVPVGQAKRLYPADRALRR